jgi:hypothetical protein
MAGKPRSLAGFVEVACERAVRWWHDRAGRDLHEGDMYEKWQPGEIVCCRTAVRDWGAEFTRLCGAGQYRTAAKLREITKLRDAGIVDIPEPLYGTVFWLDNMKAAGELTEAVILAERVDYFLAALEREGTTRQLARDCRDDLDLLLVLADWCHDAGLPRAAAEARHLHGLVRSYSDLP